MKMEIDWDVVEETIDDLGLGSIHDLYATPKINNQLQTYVMGTYSVRDPHLV